MAMFGSKKETPAPVVKAAPAPVVEEPVAPAVPEVKRPRTLIGPGIKFTGSCINTHHLFTFFTFAITQFSQSFRFLAERAS